MYYKVQDEGEGRIVRRDLNSEQEIVLYRTPGRFENPTLSPDGAMLAFVTPEDGKGLGWIVRTMPSEGGQSRELIPGARLPGVLAWTPDSGSVLYRKLSEDRDTIGRAASYTKRKCVLWRIAAKGGQPEQLELELRDVPLMSVDPSGWKIAFMDQGEGKSEVWAMENLLPPEQPEAASAGADKK